MRLRGSFDLRRIDSKSGVEDGPADFDKNVDIPESFHDICFEAPQPMILRKKVSQQGCFFLHCLLFW